jgi:hypothetical protein
MSAPIDASTIGAVIKRRHTVFIGGYDPKSPRRVHAPMREAAAAEGAHAWTVSDVDARDALRLRWTLRAPEGTETCFDALRWDDLIRQDWARSPGALAAEAWESLKLYAGTGGIARLYALAHPPVYAAMLPFALTALAILLPLLGGVLVKVLAVEGGASAWTAGLGGAAAALLLALVTGVALWRTPTTWFLRVVAFSRRYAVETRQAPGPCRKRIAAWAQQIINDCAERQVDELLVVGYSGGSILATGLMADLLRELPSPTRARLLILGNCIPAAACLRHAHALHDDIAEIARSGATWLDVTSPADWGSFYGLDCGALYGRAPSSAQRAALSPRFHTLFGPERYAALKRNKYQMHQQYWMPSELRPDSRMSYSFLDWVAGPLPLTDRLPTTT